MPICPKCGAEVDHLHAYCLETHKYEVFLAEPPLSGLSWSSTGPTDSSAEHTEFCCPECEETLYEDEASDSEKLKAIEHIVDEDSDHWMAIRINKILKPIDELARRLDKVLNPIEDRVEEFLKS